MAEYIVDIDSKITVNIGAQHLEMTRGVLQGCHVYEEIIRCCNCIQSYEVDGDIACAMFSSNRDCMVEPDGFCAWAERREGSA